MLYYVPLTTGSDANPQDYGLKLIRTDIKPGSNFGRSEPLLVTQDTGLSTSFPLPDPRFPGSYQDPDSSEWFRPLSVLDYRSEGNRVRVLGYTRVQKDKEGMYPAYLHRLELFEVDSTLTKVRRIFSSDSTEIFNLKNGRNLLGARVLGKNQIALFYQDRSVKLVAPNFPCPTVYKPKEDTIYVGHGNHQGGDQLS